MPNPLLSSNPSCPASEHLSGLIDDLICRLTAEPRILFDPKCRPYLPPGRRRLWKIVEDAMRRCEAAMPFLEMCSRPAGSTLFPQEFPGPEFLERMRLNLKILRSWLRENAPQPAETEPGVSSDPLDIVAGKAACGITQEEYRLLAVALSGEHVRSIDLRRGSPVEKSAEDAPAVTSIKDTPPWVAGRPLVTVIDGVGAMVLMPKTTASGIPVLLAFPSAFNEKDPSTVDTYVDSLQIVPQVGAPPPLPSDTDEGHYYVPAPCIVLDDPESSSRCNVYLESALFSHHNADVLVEMKHIYQAAAAPLLSLPISGEQLAKAQYRLRDRVVSAYQSLFERNLRRFAAFVQEKI